MIALFHNLIHAYHKILNVKLNKLLLLLIIGMLVVSIGSSHAMSLNAIVISGKTNNSSGGTIYIKIYAINNATNSSSIFLVGKGAIAQDDNNSTSKRASINVYDSMYSNTVINLAGNVTTSTDPNMIGKPISITTDTSTGNTTLVFGGNTYTGIEHVLIK